MALILNGRMMESNMPLPDVEDCFLHLLLSPLITIGKKM